MKITKFDHSGFYLEENGRGLLFDPVEYEHTLPGFENIDVIVITHKHSDHLQPEVLTKILQKNPSAKIYTTNDALDAIMNISVAKPGETSAAANAAANVAATNVAVANVAAANAVVANISFANVAVAKPGEKVTLGEFDLEFFGSGNHAAIYNNEIPCENLGVIVNGKVVNPGDSLDVPGQSRVEALLVPISAPWLKTEESIKYIEAVRPKLVINTHDGLLSEMGFTITNSWMSQKSAAAGAEYKFLKSGEEVEF